VISRQKVIGWTLVILSSVYLAYFLKVRVLTPGPLLEKKDWINLVVSLVGLVLGVINVRMAAMRARGEKYPWIK
jgi:hypothetical protein